MYEQSKKLVSLKKRKSYSLGRTHSTNTIGYLMGGEGGEGGGWRLLSHAQNAVRWLALFKRSVEASIIVA